MGGFGSMPTLTWDDLIHPQGSVGRASGCASAQHTTNDLVRRCQLDHRCERHDTEYFDIRAWTVAKGTLFVSLRTSSSGSKVIVLGQTVADKLFGAGVEPVGRTVRVRSVPFQIIGVLQRKGQSPIGKTTMISP